MSDFGLKNYGDVLNQGQPTGRVGTDRDMAGLTLFLASKASAHLVGNVIHTDGGSTINAGW